jgi:hypothetical protein
MHHSENNYMWRVVAPAKLAHRFSTYPAGAAARPFEIVTARFALLDSLRLLNSFPTPAN